MRCTHEIKQGSTTTVIDAGGADGGLLRVAGSCGHCAGRYRQRAFEPGGGQRGADSMDGGAHRTTLTPAACAAG